MERHSHHPAGHRHDGRGAVAAGRGDFLGHNYIGTERLLLALLAAEDDGPLTALGLDPAAAEARIIRSLTQLMADRKS